MELMPVYINIKAFHSHLLDLGQKLFLVHSVQACAIKVE